MSGMILFVITSIELALMVHSEQEKLFSAIYPFNFEPRFRTHIYVRTIELRPTPLKEPHVKIPLRPPPRRPIQLIRQ